MLGTRQTYNQGGKASNSNNIGLLPSQLATEEIRRLFNGVGLLFLTADFAVARSDGWESCSHTGTNETALAGRAAKQRTRAS